MATKFKDGTGKLKRFAFNTFALAVNSTEVGLLSATFLAAKTAVNYNVEDVVRTGARYTLLYLVPGAGGWFYVKDVENALAAGKTAYTYCKKGYTIARQVSSPIEFVNYLAAKGITKLGLVEIMKNVCDVKETDAFVWEHPEFDA